MGVVSIIRDTVHWSSSRQPRDTVHRSTARDNPGILYMYMGVVAIIRDTVHGSTDRDNPGILHTGAMPVTNLLIHELNDASLGFSLIYRKSVVRFEI